jgi:hypothetical protein
MGFASAASVATIFLALVWVRSVKVWGLENRPAVNSISPGNEGPLSHIQILRKRARQTIEDSAVTTGYAANHAAVIRLLNEALATELVYVLRYKRLFLTAKGTR